MLRNFLDDSSVFLGGERLTQLIHLMWGDIEKHIGGAPVA